jgi:fatty-acid desaturase
MLLINFMVVWIFGICGLGNTNALDSRSGLLVLLMDWHTGGGYRNGTTRDQSRNISPWGIIIGGEELHNNHHLAPASPRLSSRWFEFDIGWMYIKIFEYLRLLKTRQQ